MRALVFTPTPVRYLAGRALTRLGGVTGWTTAPVLALRALPRPRLPAAAWIRVAVRLGGICGSDLHLLRLAMSPATSALASTPFVPGHENVGTVEEVGPTVDGLRPGQRVVVDPLLPCAVRGLPPCASCASGAYNRCLRFTDGLLAPGMMIGACRETGGSWGEAFVAHAAQAHPVPEGVSDREALLAEPLACAIHAVGRTPPPADGWVLVVGGGTVGLCVVAALRALAPGARVLALVKHPFQAAMARRLGADEVVAADRKGRYYGAVAEVTGARVLRPLFGRPVLRGGATLTLECAGSARSLDDALRLTRPGGRVTLVGLAALPRGVDWTPIWLNELQVDGAFTYAVEAEPLGRRPTLAVALEWLAARRVDLAPLVTHVFPLRRYGEALATAAGKRDGAIKVALAP